MRGRGRFVVVVGPDGVGKTTFSSALLERLEGRGRYFHFRPLVRAGLALSVSHDKPLPKNRAPVSVPMGWVRLAMAVVRFWLAYLIAIWPAVRRGLVVVGDRWAYGYLVQPRSVRFGGPSWLARIALRTMPRPHVVFRLEAPVEVIRERKHELTEEEIADELTAWAAIPARTVVLDARRPTEELVELALPIVGP